MKWRKHGVKCLSILLMLAVILTSSGACFCIPRDGFLGVNGSVYEWVNPPPDAASQIYIVSNNDIEESNAELESILNDISGNISVLPLQDAIVVLGRKKDVERVEEEGYVFQVELDTDGKFEEGWMIAPTREEFLVKVSKPGYMEVVGEFENGGGVFCHGILAILVKSEDQDN